MKVCLTIIEALRAHSARAHPHECCGILLGNTTGSQTTITSALPARNVHPVPHTHFNIDPQALVAAHRAARGGGPQVLGYYHSHPAGPPEPSVTDRAGASGDERIWAIVGDNGDIGLWRDTKSGFVHLPYCTADG